MKAYVTSIGERTTDLCVWALERNGFEVVLIQNDRPLASKLEQIYNMADDDFIRVDADVIVNKTLTPQFVSQEIVEPQWWNQYQTFGWFQQNIIWGGVQFIKKEAIPILRQSVYQVAKEDRPETAMSRLEAFYNPRRFESIPACVGIHGFGQSIQDIDRVIAQKKRRNYFHTYDFELASKIERLAHEA